MGFIGCCLFFRGSLAQGSGLGVPVLRVRGPVGSLDFELQRCFEDLGVFLPGARLCLL